MSKYLSRSITGGLTSVKLIEKKSKTYGIRVTEDELKIIKKLKSEGYDVPGEFRDLIRKEFNKLGRDHDDIYSL